MRKMTTDEEIDYSPMLRRACIASFIGFSVKVLAMWRVSADVHAVARIRSWFGIPYLALTVGRGSFTRVTSSSTVALAFVVMIIVVLAVLRAGDVMRTAGWLFAIVGLASTIVVDAVLHHVERPYTDPQRLRWATGSLALCLFVAVAWVLFEHPLKIFLDQSKLPEGLSATRSHPVFLAFALVFLALAFAGLCTSSIFDRPNLLAGSATNPHTVFSR